MFDFAGARAHGGRHSRSRPRPRGSLLERFNRYAVRSADPDACWDWSASSFQSGYGALAAAPPSREMLSAHRVSFELHVGPIPAGLCCLHRCDQPRCTNPRHLFLGTIQDNNHDKMMKCRQSRGEGHPRAKLTQQQVDLIRSIHSCYRASMRELAEWFGVSRGLISMIVRNRIWMTT
jgi:hypothetical protein